MKLSSILSIALVCGVHWAYSQVSKVDETKFKQYKTVADSYFDQKDFKAARRFYQMALLNKPNEKASIQRIEDCNKKLESASNKFLKEGNKLFDKGNIEGATAQYDSAYLYYPLNPQCKTEQEKAYNANLNNTFQKVVAGTHFDWANSAVTLQDGGMVIAGRSDSNTSGDNMNKNIIRLDANGNVLWNNFYGEAESEEAWAIAPCKDGGFLTVGYSDSYGSGSGMKDVWVLKIDKDGKKQWDKVFVTNEAIDEATSVIENEDGTFMVVGNSIPINPGNIGDVIVIKIGADGQELWKKEYKDEGNDEANEIIKIKDGYLIAGRMEVEKKRWDACLIKIDKDGNKQWTKTFGGGDDDLANAVVQTKDEGFVMVGHTYSYAKAGSFDAWVVKLDKNGTIKWEDTYGSGASDEFLGVVELSDGSIVAAGYTESYLPVNNVNTSKDGDEIFIVKISAVGDEVWQRTWGGVGNQRIQALEVNKEAMLIMVGYVEDPNTRNTDVLAIKANKGGVFKKTDK